ncbi:MAG: rod shape-determining protein MreD [Xylophilus ampelinus]
MIMRKGQQLLLPANPAFIWASLLAALLVNLLPVGRIAWMPDLLLVLLVFWSVHQPLRVGLGAAFAFGLAMDVHHGALLGHHALVYTAMSFGAISLHRRLLWFSVPWQAAQVFWLFFAARAVEVLLRLATGGLWPGWGVLAAPAIEALLWPVVSMVLLAPQRRSPDPDENRPI